MGAFRVVVRRGFTLIEALAVLAVISLLLALFAPAIQQVRESARRVQCSTHLKQFGLAITNYEATHRVLPEGYLHKYQLLPELGESTLYQAVTMPTELPLRIPTGAESHWRFVADKAPSYFRCPSDPSPGVVDSGPPMVPGSLPQFTSTTSYVVNGGAGVQRCGHNGMFAPVSTAGPLKYPLPGRIRMSDATNGASNTTLMSETLYHTKHPSRLAAIWMLPSTWCDSGDLDCLLSLCPRIAANPSDRGYATVNLRGLPWWGGNFSDTMFTHTQAPNTPSCGLLPGVSEFFPHNANSAHPEGANVLYGDGHVAFVSQSIDEGVWRQAGSRVPSAKRAD